MAGSVNKVILVGNLGADPEVRRTQDGKSICNLRLATTDTWRDKTGERREKTEWHSVVIFNEQLVKIVEQYLKKGAKIYVEGQLQSRKWQDNSGTDRYTTEVVLQNYNGQLTMLDAPPAQAAPAQRSLPAPSRAPVAPRQNGTRPPQAPQNKYPGRASHDAWADPAPTFNADDDEIPFLD